MDRAAVEPSLPPADATKTFDTDPSLGGYV
jgi:hypothetical protein